MPAFSKKSYEFITAALNSLSERARKNHYPPDITKEQLYPMLVRPEHIQVLNDADALAGPLQRHSNIAIPFRLDGKTPTILFYFSEELIRLVPPYVYQNGFHTENIDDYVYYSVKAWVERRIQIGRDWIEAKRLVKNLNDEVSNVRQMAFYCHGIVALMNQSDDLRTRVGDLGEFRVPGIVPGISREMRDAGVKATQTIARSLLLSSDPPPEKSVTMEISTTTCALVRMPWAHAGSSEFYID